MPRSALVVSADIHVSLALLDPGAADAPTSPTRDLQEALERLERAAPDDYYDPDADLLARDEYYHGLDLESADPAALYDVLSARLEASHERVLSYKAARLQYLYPLVDLVRDGQRLFLRSLYSPHEYDDVEAFVRAEFTATQDFEAAVADLRAQRRSLGDEALARDLATLEERAGFNCEHVVPRAWFSDKLPMVSDLHHLFTCEQQCNARRASSPYAEFAGFPAHGDDEQCGESIGLRFEPRHRKAAAARATLYFLVRYPGRVSRELYASEQLARLADWSAADPPGEWERHRNAEIAHIQGVRNPFIDFPQLAARVDVVRGLAD
ncbi:endonuclease [Nannocystis radixulma]|uniref:Endonuclease n=1 Tax=Nannocystis radixulma TaxID=2995305 RepID=A0ABT5AZ89_9BACT|nr:endonuclease [Nannocystis radixulma]MDC0667157.1 endonuclease [Nannocystis radixulma]